ncbi:1-acyl-sn-glycerol-3-phosphate acyltransferase alpha-like isoform X2 [Anopheles aquasalis]|uniref:1-acyl-sn-glycerol-3-phosphate acyltransferase alpha-like isoform X2 n=1 Tax=Anopheles aquasalis TaxID=42839 RepID=UPI00215B2DD0|nr:1-acyl-sn-glycerol-3-phosphate acyltransferase alpha-like isoform X2 [Anopheles aquasalis]XP_050099897.1 1-acyl-sn-glycerol-3-phosphate acyltransferase alpha-like isoform X2 [Anopheles aquasalis]XP_050099898.1 1-acyl-sn-glycerol-3-phosphate acyltransferase alpha-like isoform X2 [Anopheles aquasalis]
MSVQAAIHPFKMTTTSNGELLGLAFMAFFIITLSSTARYYFKFFCFIALSVVCAVGPVPLMLLRPRDYRNAIIPAYLCVGFGKMLGASFTVRGKENIQRNHGGVVLMNHQSALDLIVLAKLWPIMGRSTVVAKKEVLYMFPFGMASWLWGTLFIDRQNRDSARNAINKEAKAITEKQAKLLFFPEGTRGSGDKLLAFKKGSFHVAVESQAYIQPVVISKYHFLKSNAKIFNRGENIIKILPEISCAGLTKEDIPALMEQVQQLMQHEYELLSEESLAINNLSEVH